MGDFYHLSLLVFLGSVAGLIGGLIMLFKKTWAKSLSEVAIPLAAGVLLSLSLLDLLPRAVDEIGDSAFTVVLLVFVVFFLVEKFLFSLHHHHDADSHDIQDQGVWMVIIGDTIHNFLDGTAIAASFLLNPTLGLVVAFSTFLHETPHEIADFGILLARGWSKKRVFYANFLSALATFPGAFIVYYFGSETNDLTGILLSLSAGLFLYVATTDFLPEVGHVPIKSVPKQAGFLILGILITVVVGYFVPEIH